MKKLETNFKSKSKLSFSSLRMRLAGIVLLASVPALVFLYFTQLPWLSFALALPPLLAAWFGGERFVLRHVHRLAVAVKGLEAGDLSSRTGLAGEPDGLGELARAFDNMAASLEQRAHQQEMAEQTLLARALQQTAVAALGQLALTTTEIAALSSQGVTLITQNLGVEFCAVFEMIPGGRSMRMQAGMGWRSEIVGRATVGVDRNSQAGYTMNSGEPVAIANLQTEKRFNPEPLLTGHGIVSGISLAIGVRDKTYGMLGVYSTRERNFVGDDLQFLMAIANILALAVERRTGEEKMKKLAELAQLNPYPAVELAADGQMTYFNQAAIRLAKVLGQGHPGDDFVPRDIRKVAQSCLATGQSRLDVESRSEGRVLSWSLHPASASQVVHCYVTDITERLNLEARLRQAQKGPEPAPQG